MGIPLNPAQKAAVEHGTGPALVLAGAGSGKTRVITQRMERLILSGVPARAIFAVTFTNKASQEMRERLEHLVGPPAKEVWISTFHALGGEIVRREMPRGEAFVVYDGADCSGLVKELLRDHKGDVKRLDVAAIVARISGAKNCMCTPAELVIDGGNEYDEVADWVFPRYEAALKRLKALDFDDLILWPLKHLTDDASAREAWRRRVRFMLVDEFQDTNRAQLLLVKSLVGEAGNVFCVGDDDQSIYGWRGADISNVIDFGKHFPGAKTLALEQNYRSRRPILDLSNAVMEGQVRAYPKRLFTDKPGGEPCKIVECDSNEGEIKFVMEVTQKLLRDGYKRREIAVLYRSNLLSRGVEEALRLANIPYRLIGGTSVYERREVKDLIAYLRLAVHPSDEISLRRVINYPTRGIGEVTIARLERSALVRGISLFAACERADILEDLSPSIKESIRGFVGIVRGARASLEKNNTLHDVAQQTAVAVKLKEDIIAAGPTAIAAGKRWGNVDYFFKSLEKSEARGVGESSTVLARMMLNFGSNEEEDTDRVTLSTLHGSKGLEFGTVFFIGCDEGIIPHSRTDSPKATDVLATIDAGEERRLFYVGVTRAKEQLYLVRAKTRSGRGPARATAPSRFLKFEGLPEGTLETVQYDSQAPLAPQDIAAQMKSFRQAMEALRARRG
ncbi:MAG: UvrD-helicase domain-containing protein [Myxococcales bacterium]|nr:UvrD-helicase domain-containing protein [Myxococcales bacterium]